MAAAATSTLSPASGSFGRLLKSSKVVSQFDPSIPLVYTTYGGSKKRSDYGLKRALPQIKTPAIRVHSLDSSLTKLTEFSYAAKEYTFVKSFKESNVKIGAPSGSSNTGSLTEQRERISKVAEAPGGCAWDKDGFLSIEDLKEQARTGRTKQQRRKDAAQAAYRREQIAKKLGSEEGLENAIAVSADVSSSSVSSNQAPSTSSTETIPQFPPDYLHMPDKRFETFLEQLESLRPRFLQFLRSRSASRSADALPDRQHYTDVLKDAREAPQFGSYIDEFLAQESVSLRSDTSHKAPHDPALNQLKTQEPYSLGLTYAPPNLYMSDKATAAIPARILDLEKATSKQSAFSQGGGIPLSLLGTIATHSRSGTIGSAPATAYSIDPNGEHNMNFGRVTVRVEHAHIRHPALNGSSGAQGKSSPDEILHGVEVDQVDNPVKAPTLLDADPVQMNLYGDGQARGSLAKLRIGSPEWIAHNPQVRSLGMAVQDKNVSSLFGEEAYRSAGLRPPNPSHHDRDSQIKNRKGRERHLSDDQASSRSDTANLIATLSKLTQKPAARK